MKTKTLPLTIIALLAVGNVNAAAIVIKPTDAVAYSTFDTTRTPSKTYSNAGTSLDTGATVPVTWNTLTEIKTTGWMSAQLQTGNLLADQWIVFDLGDTYALDGMNIWGFALSSNVDVVKAMDDFNVSFATTLSDTFGSQNSVDNDFSGAISSSLSNPILSNTDGDFFGLNSTARYVLINPTSIETPTQLYVGIGEIRFTGSVVPEPSAALLSLCGLALMLRRRR